MRDFSCLFGAQQGALKVLKINAYAGLRLHDVLDFNLLFRLCNQLMQMKLVKNYLSKFRNKIPTKAQSANLIDLRADVSMTKSFTKKPFV